MSDALIESLHDAAMSIAYDDASEWQGDCPLGYKANLLAMRIEELVESYVRLAAEGKQ